MRWWVLGGVLVIVIMVQARQEQEDTLTPRQEEEEEREGGEEEEEDEEEGEYVEQEDPLFLDARTERPPLPSLVMVHGLRNTTKDAGGSLKLRCEVEGSPPATEFRWYKNDAPVQIERGRVRVKTELNASPQWSMFRINELETLDTAFYRCVYSAVINYIKLYCTVLARTVL